MGRLKKQFQYIIASYKTKRFAGIMNYALRVLDAFFLPAVTMAKPIKLQTETIEGICNIDCGMCRANESPKKDEMKFEQFKIILDKLPYCLELKLTGCGETMLVKDLLKMIAYAKNKGIHVSFYTNGILLDREKSDAFIGVGLDEITFSLNAATAQTYLSIMSAAAFEKVTGNIRSLMELKRLRWARRPLVRLSFVAMKKNIHELPLFIELAADLGVHAVIVQALSLTRSARGMEHETLFHDPLLRDGHIRQAKKIAHRKGILLSYPSFRNKQMNYLNMCQEPWTKMQISIQGDVTPCCRVNTGFGNIFNDDIDAIWNGHTYRAFRKMVKNNRLPCEYCYALAKQLGLEKN